jgi:hypothetical protein
MMIWEGILSAIGGGAFALAIAAWLARRWINHRFESELESHKAQLVQKSEVLKTELSIYAHEQNVGLTRIDEQRSESIQSIWGILTRWHEIFLTITAPNAAKGQVASQAFDTFHSWSNDLTRASNKLAIEVRNRAIFFPQTAYETIARCASSIAEVTNRYYDSSFEDLKIGIGFPVPDYEAQLALIHEARNQLQKSAQDSVDELHDTLIAEFRLLMGAEKSYVNNALYSNR